MKTSARTAWDSLRTSYWFVPTLMVFAAVALWGIVFLVDLTVSYEFGRIWWLYTGGPEGARSLMSALIGAMITVAGVVFSITVVVLTLASQQFGPLLLRNFVRDKGSQIVLGTFVSTFVFCLLALRTVRGNDPDIFVPEASVTTGVALGIVSIGVLVYFIHHISVFIQAPHLIDVVYQDLDQTIDRIFPEQLGKPAAANPTEEQDRKAASQFDLGSGVVKSESRGYVNEIDSDALLSAASRHGLVVRLLRYPGDFVVAESDLVQVLPPEAVNHEVASKLNDAFIFGARRTSTQDLDFLFSQLVEIAVRSLSPGINDPFTAVIVIDHLCAAFCKLAARAMPSPYRHDDDGNLRVVASAATFVRLFDAGFNPTRYYGKKHPAVLARLLWAIATAAPFVHRSEDRQALAVHARLIRKAALESIESEEDRQDVLTRFDEAMKTLDSSAAAESGSAGGGT